MDPNQKSARKPRRSKAQQCCAGFGVAIVLAVAVVGFVVEVYAGFVTFSLNVNSDTIGPLEYDNDLISDRCCQYKTNYACDDDEVVFDSEMNQGKADAIVCNQEYWRDVAMETLEGANNGDYPNHISVFSCSQIREIIYETETYFPAYYYNYIGKTKILDQKVETCVASKVSQMFLPVLSALFSFFAIVISFFAAATEKKKNTVHVVALSFIILSVGTQFISMWWATHLFAQVFQKFAPCEGLDQYEVLELYTKEGYLCADDDIVFMDFGVRYACFLSGAILLILALFALMAVVQRSFVRHLKHMEYELTDRIEETIEVEIRKSERSGSLRTTSRASEGYTTPRFISSP